MLNKTSAMQSEKIINHKDKVYFIPQKQHTLEQKEKQNAKQIIAQTKSKTVDSDPVLEFNISREKMSINKVNLEFSDEVYEAEILLKNSYPNVEVLQKVVKSKFSK